MVKKIANAKKIISCDENQNIRELFKIFLNNYRRVPVTGDGEIKGMVCLTDLLDYLGAGERHQFFLDSKSPLDVSIKKIMIGNPYIIKAGMKPKGIIKIFKKTGRGAYPVVSGKKLTGMITEWDILNIVKNEVSNLNVGDIMSTKPFTVKKNDTIFDASKMMVKGGFRRLPIVENGFLLGIITPSDILYHLYSKNKVFSLRKDKILIKQIMRKNVLSARPDTGIGKIMNFMIRRKIGGLPVTEDRELLGIITERDIVNLVNI
ncbi:MAG: CBS domain-containing protein [Candidatus Aenigmarchaeota archaeon]|nr:CBS domain-containing protein [Candidatus Aenigmarchaeota archaeon]